MSSRISFAAQEPRLLKAARMVVKGLPGGCRAMLVGGFVRDCLLGIASKDADLETYGIEAEVLETVLKELFDDKIETVGRSFGIYKIFLGDGFDLDVAIPRRESKSGSGHTGFEVEGDPELDPKEAARRRDFTINAIAADPKTGELFDPFNGQDDIKDRILRVVDGSTFVDDPLRVYRGVQFTARFGLRVEPSTLELMRLMVARGELDTLSKERVTDELKKLLLKAPKPSVGFELMRTLGLIRRDYPELHALIDTPQEPEWHPEGDVWIHTMMVIDEAAGIVSQNSKRKSQNFTEEERLQVMMGALCHDLGKPSTTAPGEKDGVPRVRSIGHEEAGVTPTEALFDRFAFGESVRQASIASAKDHLKPGMLWRQLEKGTLTEEAYVNAVRKLIKRTKPTSWRVLLAISEADHFGRGLPDIKHEPYAVGETFARMVEEHRLDGEGIKPLLLGRDLQALGMKPGPLMGRLLKEIERLRDEGKIKTKKDALAYVNRFTFTSNPFE
ncbi:MAG: HD domain-containing protein [Patescibacteria group bacterium]